jgi:hypothetical protein
MLKLLAALLLFPAGLPPQAPGSPIAGTWQLTKGNVKGDGPKSVVIRSDSSASWGKETVRWRLASDSIRIAIGGEWETYKLKVGKDQLTLTGGDLSGPITLKRTGPPTPRAEGVAVPPDPDTEPPVG